MRNPFKVILFLNLFIITSTIISQVKNPFLNRNFWKTNPSIKTIKQKIQEGHSPSALNKFGFDAVVYALLENNSKEVIKYLLSKKGNDINKLTHDGRTYIFWATYKNNLPIVKYLLANGAKTTIIDDKGYSILNFAAVTGVDNPKLYDLFIKHGANVLTEVTPKGANPLLLIIPNLKDFSMVGYFIDKGLSLYSTDKNGNGAFNYTAQKGNKSMLSLLIKKGLPHKKINKIGGNAMLFATKPSRKGYNSLDFFKYLEKLGISPNITNKEGINPLHNLAYRNNDINTFHYFINKGLDINQVDNEGNTPLLNAASRNSIEIIQLLTNQNTNINHVNKKGQPALMKALNNKMDVIQFLLSKGASIAHTDNMGNNLSYYLFNTFSSKEDTAFLKKLKILEAKGLVVTKPQGNGNTLYHLAVKKQQLPLLHFIKKYTIDINARNQEGLSPLQKAVMTAKNDVIIKYLISEGANTSIKTEFNETLYDLAKENEALKGIDLNFLQ
ncbi:ankyrin repeat domain-containing protein [Tenacibaculum maritimum]|uniref:ankyrin repeat domain-containing protein n=1 Tax=Tenacibaculum maritimum TaxID=107401 RepID=UPI0012E46870|nr:ankyrin repeat domain-containing protein [Tenacibaculum maritimum]CAA0210869.1 conserved hypothetical protein [Tenacibaculum maritimum]